METGKAETRKAAKPQRKMEKGKSGWRDGIPSAAYKKDGPGQARLCAFDEKSPNHKEETGMARFVLTGFTDEYSPALSEQIKCCKELGLSGIDLRGIDGRNGTELSDSQAKALKAALDEEGLRVTCMGSPLGKISVTDPFEPQLALFARTLELCRILDVKRLRLFSFYIPKGEDPARYRGEVMKRLHAFVKAAQGSGVTLLHENEKGIYGDTADRCLDLLTEMDGGMQAIFDPANFVQCGENVLEAWEKLEYFVESLHVKDATNVGFVVPAGYGVGELDKIIRRFSAKEGPRYLTCEPHLTLFAGREALDREEARLDGRFLYPDPKAAYRAAVDALKEILLKTHFAEEKGEPGVWTR